MFYFGPDGENGRKQYDDFEYAGEKRIVEIDRIIGPRVAQRVHIYGNGLYLRHDAAFVFTTGEQCLLYRCCGCKCCRRLEAAEFQSAGYEIRAVGIIRDFWPAVGVKVGSERRRYDYESENFAFCIAFLASVKLVYSVVMESELTVVNWRVRLREVAEWSRSTIAVGNSSGRPLSISERKNA